MTTAPSKAVLDTNLLLLFLVGETDRSLLRNFKRVNTFGEEDVELLHEVLRGFREVMTTPHILAEVSNFVDQAPSYRREVLNASLKRYAKRHLERFEPAADLVERSEFRLLALTDTGLVSLSNQAVILTMDHMLAHEVLVQGGHAINFNHLRGARLLRG